MWRTRRSVLGRLPKSILLAERRSTTSASELIEVGRFTEQRVGSKYKAGQIFLHRVFAYRGIIMFSHDCKEFGRKHGTNQYEIVPYYQCLIHKDDWKEMRFAKDMTAYLADAADDRGAKSIHFTNGLDCVTHADVLPLLPAIGEHRAPIDHALFRELFKLNDEEKPELGYTLFRDLNAIRRNWMLPQNTHIERADSITAMVTTYYLGQATFNGHPKHCWRYVVRLENHDSDRDVILRERSIKVFSLNSLSQATAPGAVGARLGREYPAFQFSSTIELNNKRGSHMWGKLKLERDDGSCFDVNLPTVLLESNAADSVSQTSENNIIH